MKNCDDDKESKHCQAFQVLLQAGEREVVLSQRDRKILDLESQWWKYPGSKEQVIRELFTMSSTQYYQVLNNLISSEEALAYAPMVVNRLRQVQAARVPRTSTRRLKVV